MWVTLSYGWNISHVSTLEWPQDGLHLCWVYLQLQIMIIGHISHWLNYLQLNGFISGLHGFTVGLYISLWLILEEAIKPEISNFTKSYKIWSPFANVYTTLCEGLELFDAHAYTKTEHKKFWVLVEDPVQMLSEQPKEKDSLLNSKILPSIIGTEQKKCNPSCNGSRKSLLIPWLSDQLCERQKCGRNWWFGNFGHYLQFGWCLEMPCGLRAGEKILHILWINVNCGHKFECCFLT